MSSATPRIDPPPAPSPGFGSDAIADLLRALEFDYIALTPGASFRGLHDSLVNYLGNTRPRMLLCVHEEHAVALAHGYARVTGRPMAVALHANVGLMHATMAIFNAWCDRIPDFHAGRRRPDGRRQAPAVGRLDPHIARPRRADPRLHQVGRSARLGRGRARSDGARVSHRDHCTAAVRCSSASMPPSRKKLSQNVAAAFARSLSGGGFRRPHLETRWRPWPQCWPRRADPCS